MQTREGEPVLAFRLRVKELWAITLSLDISYFCMKKEDFENFLATLSSTFYVSLIPLLGFKNFTHKLFTVE